MAASGDRRFLVVVLLAATFAITLPYLLAARGAGAAYVFGGFLLNPLDGNSYLAKMYQGWRGDWLFTLPFTAETGQGAFLFTFYLLLGHLARLFHIPLVLCYHLARIFSAVALWLVLAAYLRRAFGSGSLWRYTLIAAIFGSGLGWLGLPFGAFTPDFWVAEGYPFLSAYSNPHFSLGLAILLSLLLPLQGEAEQPGRGWAAAIATAVLAFLSPFAVVVCLVVYACMAAIDFATRNRADFWHKTRRLAFILAGASLPVLYQLWVIRTDPVLSGWNAQNLTPSPPVWETLLALGILLVPALAGLWTSIRRRDQPGLVAATWIVCAMVLLYLPWGLQRRFFVGLYLPVVVLAGVALQAWNPSLRLRKLAFAGLLLGLLPTNLIVVTVQILGARTAEPRYYYRVSEAQSYEWIEASLDREAVILASPESGMFIPAHTGRRVVYGHPYETVNAQAKQSAVLAYFRGDLELGGSEFFQPVDYVYIGPREHLLGKPALPSHWPIVYRNEEVVIFQVAR